VLLVAFHSTPGICSSSCQTHAAAAYGGAFTFELRLYDCIARCKAGPAEAAAVGLAAAEAAQSNDHPDSKKPEILLQPT